MDESVVVAEPEGSTSPAASVPLRFITATSLFDGHDAAINIMRRLIQARGAEVIHLGHNRSVEDIVRAALQEDADAIAVSSYQGGHLEYLRFMIEMLRERGAGHIRVFAGGGGTITPAEIRQLHGYGVAQVYHPQDGLRLGLDAMIDDVVERARCGGTSRGSVSSVTIEDELSIGRALTELERGLRAAADFHVPNSRPPSVPVIGVTGTGGSGKSSVVDELLLRFLAAFPAMRIAVLAVDPTRRRTGGALLGDRIRMNALRSNRTLMRSMATRRQHAAINRALPECVALLRRLPIDLIIVETAGIGQADSVIVDHVDFSVYVMTTDYGAPSQLEKLDMLDLADLIVMNKADTRGAEDALRHVRKQWRRNRSEFAQPDEWLPIYPTIARQFSDPGVNVMFDALCRSLVSKLKLAPERWTPAIPVNTNSAPSVPLIPSNRVRYLAEIAEHGRSLEKEIDCEASLADRLVSCWTALGEVSDSLRPPLFSPYPTDHDPSDLNPTLATLRRRYDETLDALAPEALQLLKAWPARHEAIAAAEYHYDVRGKTVGGSNYVETLSRQRIPKIAPPTHFSAGQLLRFLMKENLPGAYPFTAGVYPYRRTAEDPIRMFAGEGTPERTNRRFHYLSAGQAAARLSTAFDSVTLYGEDPHPRPDIYGKVGNSGVSIATLDDMKKLYSGFDLCAPTTSASMTINGPAPIILAMFLNTAIDQAVERHLRQDSGPWRDAQATIRTLLESGTTPEYAGGLPTGHNGLGLGLLGVTGDQLVTPETYHRIKTETLSQIRGTVQADILKEDQAQNTCIFNTQFALRMMGDIQEYFIAHRVRNFYSVSISGYHIAEAGANPISQLAFTLANGFTIVEYYLARGMCIDDFAANLSFFFSNGMDPEYSVIGRVARRIWARAMRDRYHASARSQMLKYHIQTSGRSLHAQEIHFNDIRTTLQALYALVDNCNSLHTNAYDEAITTPTEESVRRAVAIQLIINREFGLNMCQNAWQGSFFIEYLTDLVERAVYEEFDALNERGGVLGAMDLMYQRGKIQEESLYYEQKKHDGTLPIVGVNTFKSRADAAESPAAELIRSSRDEKEQQIANVRRFQERRNACVNQNVRAAGPGSLRALQDAAREQRNVFERLMEAVKYYSLGQITAALYEVGGEYRRNM